MKTTTYTTLSDLHDNLLLRNSVQEDFIEPFDRIKFDVGTGPLLAEIRDTEYVIGETAHENLRVASEMGAYYDKLLAKDNELLAYNLNARLGRNPKPMMIRTEINDENQPEVRGFLSNSYKIIDGILGVDELREYEPYFDGWQMTEAYVGHGDVRVNFTNPGLRTEVKAVDDVIEYGIQMRTNELGGGRFSFLSGIKILRCLNGAWGFDTIAKVNFIHRGTPMFNDEALLLSKKTLQLEADLTRSAIRDGIKQAMSMTIEKLAPLGAMLNAAAERKIPSNIHAQKVIELVAKKYNVRGADDMLNRFTRNGMISQYGVADAVTEMARDTESLEHRLELQETGAKIYAMNATNWGALLQAAA